MSSRRLPFDLITTNPCSASWSEMHGDYRSRHCESCQKRVHNLAAMTPREIEQLVLRSNGDLCARITRRADGSLVTLDPRPRPRGVATALSATLAFAGAASAQTPPTEAKAHLSGAVVPNHKDAPFTVAFISLESNGKTVAIGKINEQGQFAVSVEPGVYDLHLWSMPDAWDEKFNVVIRAANLHEGEQVLQIPQPRPEEFVVTLGELVPVKQVPRPLYALRHPIRYLKHVARSR